jgi:two-component system response regulator FlrC
LIIQSGSNISASDIVINATPSTAGSSVMASTPMDAMLNEDFELEQVDLGGNLKSREYTLILDALRSEKNKKLAAEKLGISPRTLRYKMAQMREQGVDFHGNIMA